MTDNLNPNVPQVDNSAAKRLETVEMDSSDSITSNAISSTSPKKRKVASEHRKQVDNGKFKHFKIVNMMIDNGLLVDNTDLKGVEKQPEIAKAFLGQLKKEVDAIRKEEIEPLKAQTKEMINLRIELCKEEVEVFFF